MIDGYRLFAREVLRSRDCILVDTRIDVVADRIEIRRHRMQRTACNGLLIRSSRYSDLRVAAFECRRQR